MAKTSSPMPRVIMANGVAAFLVVTQPSASASTIADSPPTMGIRLTGIGRLPLLTMFKAWIARNEPMPE